MAGAHVKVTVRDRGVMAALERVAAADRRLIVPFLKNAGEAMVKSTRARFDTETDPSGKKWPALLPAYKAGKRGTKMLRESGLLYGSIAWRVTGHRLAWGTNRVYAAAQQFGAAIVPRSADALYFRLGGRLVRAQKVTIPARPYLGISAADRAVLTQLAKDVITTAWGS